MLANIVARASSFSTTSRPETPLSLFPRTAMLGASFVLLATNAAAQPAPRATPSPRTSGGICDVDPAACPPPSRPFAPIAPPRGGTESAPPRRRWEPVPARAIPVPVRVADAEWTRVEGALAAHATTAALEAIGRITSNPAHPHFSRAASTLATLARSLPDAADSERYFGAVGGPVIAMLPASPREASPRAAASFLAGRYAYFAGRVADAIVYLDAVPAEDPLAPRARLLAAGAHVREWQSVPAIRSLQAARAALDAAPPSAERTWQSDVAFEAEGRIQFSTAIRPDENDTPRVDEKRLSAAVLAFERVDAASPIFPDVARELAWSYYLAGDMVRAGGHARFLAGSGAHATEARLLLAAIATASCRYDEAIHLLRALDRDAAVHGKLVALGAAIDRPGDTTSGAAMLAAARRGPPPAPELSGPISRVLADPEVARSVRYLDALDTEARARAGSPLGAPIGPERERVTARISGLVAESLGRERDEMAGALAERDRLLVLVTAATRNTIAPALAATLVGPDEARARAFAPTRPFTNPFERLLPDDVRRYASGLFYTRQETRCAR